MNTQPMNKYWKAYAIAYLVAMTICATLGIFVLPHKQTQFPCTANCADEDHVMEDPADYYRGR